MTNQELETALLVVKASRPKEGSGPVNPLLLDQVCNIATAALETLERMVLQKEQVQSELASIQRTRHDAYEKCLAAMVLLERAVAVRVDDDWLKEARKLLKAFKA